MEQLLLDLTSRIAKLERAAEALRATEQRGFRGCRLTHNANQAITAFTLTAVAFNTEIFDYGSVHDTATNNSRVTIPADGDGFWCILASIRWSYAGPYATTDYIQTFITKNGGTNYIAQDDRYPLSPVGASTGLTLSVFDNAVAGDYFEIKVASTVNQDIVSLTGLSPYFMAVRIPT